MRHLVLCMLSCAAVFTVQAEVAREWHFDDVRPGELPSGWIAAKTCQGPGSAWQVVEDATAPSSGNVLAQTSSAGPNALFNLCLAGDTDQRDVDLSVKFKALKGANDQGGGLVWRYQDADNYYVARANPLEDNFRVYKVVNGKRTQLESADVKTSVGAWHTLRVVHMGDRMACFLDGKQYLAAKDGAFQRAGKVGLWTKSDAVTSFDDLTLRAAR